MADQQAPTARIHSWWIIPGVAAVVAVVASAISGEISPITCAVTIALLGAHSIGASFAVHVLPAEVDEMLTGAQS